MGRPRISIGVAFEEAVSLSESSGSTRTISPPWPLAEVLQRNHEGWARGSPTLAICELDGTCVGLVWMNVRDPDPSTGFVGYWLLPRARGRGLATRAVRLLSAWVLGVTAGGISLLGRDPVPK